MTLVHLVGGIMFAATHASDPGHLRQLLTRRGVMRLGLGVGGALLVLGSGAGFVFRAKPAAQGRVLLSVDEGATVAALADAYFPEGNEVGVAANHLDIAGSVDAYMARLLPREQRLLRALFTLIEQWPRTQLASGFSALSLDDRIAMLTTWETSALEQRQALASVLRTIVAVSYFDEPRVLAAIGHRHGCLPVLPS